MIFVSCLHQNASKYGSDSMREHLKPRASIALHPVVRDFGLLVGLDVPHNLLHPLYLKILDPPLFDQHPPICTHSSCWTWCTLSTRGQHPSSARGRRRSSGKVNRSPLMLGPPPSGSSVGVHSYKVRINFFFWGGGGRVVRLLFSSLLFAFSYPSSGNLWIHWKINKNKYSTLGCKKLTLFLFFIHMKCPLQLM